MVEKIRGRQFVGCGVVSSLLSITCCQRVSLPGKMDEKKRARKNQGDDKKPPDKRKNDEKMEMKKLNPDKKETTTGILRLDFGKPRRSSGGSVDFRGVPDRLGAQGEPPSPQPSVDRLSVTFAEKSDCSESSVKVNIFDPGSPPSHLQEMDKVRFCKDNTVTDGEDEEDDDYSASLSVIMQRRESTRRTSSKKKKRRPSSPFSGDGDSGLYENRRRSSVYTNSSGETGISVEDGTTQEQIFENIRLHKEVLSNVKLQPWTMRRKIKLVQQAKAYVKRHEGELQERLAQSKSTKDILARFNIWLVKQLQFLRRELANTMTLLIPWELRIKEIESHFGSAVASYFTFLRWMFWVNLVIAVVLACFVAIPEMLTADVKSAGERKIMLPEEKETATDLVTLWDFEGILKYSPIFYGYYTNKDGAATGYRLPFAYFMTGLAVYVYSFVATLRRMAKNSRMSKLSEKGDECVFTWKLFTGWDYMIGNAETAHNRVASLILGFKEALLEETEKKKDEKNWKVISLRVLVNFLVLCLLVFSAYVVFIVVERSTEPESDDSWWRQNEITVSLSIISIIFPIFFELLGLMEGYHPRKCLRIQLARIMVLNLLNLYTLIFSQFWKINLMSKELQELKNYTLSLNKVVTTTASLPEVVTPLCIDIPVPCTTTAGPTEPSLTTTLASVMANITLTTLLPLLGNKSTDFTTADYVFNGTTEPSLNFSDFSFSDFLNVSETNFFNVTEFLTTEESSITTQEASGPKKTDSTIPYLVTILANIIKTGVFTPRVNKTKMVTTTEVDLNVSEETETSSYFETETFESTTEDFLTATITGIIDNYVATESNICYVRKCEEEKTTTTTQSSTVGILDEDDSPYDMETRKKLRRLCWETMFGQELVKLTVMDLVLTIFSIFLLDFFRAVFVRVMNNCWCWDLEKKFPQYGDFKIAENILHLVNNQGMVWMGMFFSPGLPAINVIKLAVMMYLRSWAVLTCNVPHEVVFRASRSNNFYLALLLTMLFLCVLPVGFAIVWIEPSWHCGPFAGYKRIYHLFTESLLRVIPKQLHTALDYMSSPGIIIPLLMLLILIIYYLISLTNSLREANNDLKIQLRRERTEERRKMFQMVDKRARKGSKDSETPFAKWKKLLPDLSPKPITPSPDVEKGEKIENGTVIADKKDAKKELLSRLMKKALRKSSGTSDDDSPLPDDGTDGEHHDSPFDEHVRPKKKQTERSRKKPDVHQVIKSEKKAVLENVHRKNERKKSPNSAESTQRNSLGSEWSENIPVITISKTESDECILKDKNSPEVQGKTEKNKGKFKEKVEKEILRQREEKERLSRKLDEKASEMQKKDKKGDKPKTKNSEETKSQTANKQEHKKEKEEPKDVKETNTKEEEDTEKETTSNEKKESEEDKKCPLAKEETVSSDLDLSLVSLKVDENNASKTTS